MAKWDQITEKGSVSDQRSSGGLLATGIIGSLGGIIALGVMLLGGDSQLASNLGSLVDQVVGNTALTQTNTSFSDPNNYQVFASEVLGSTNQVWRQQFSTTSKTYSPPTLVLFRNSIPSGCGGAYSQIGPHYCPVDSKIYLDETFFEELTNRFGGSSSQVAQAYVIAHEVGHHVQDELGLTMKADQDTASNAQNANQISIQVELQADCLAGVWAGNIQQQGILEKNEINDAISAAKAVGDDNIQQTTSGHINPEKWTHGTSAQRSEAVIQGYDSKSLQTCLNQYTY